MSNFNGIPEKVKLADGSEIVVKDNPALLQSITDAIQNARKEEKDKLYSTISSLESQKKVLEDEKKQNGELTKAQKEELDKVKGDLAVAKAEKEKLEKEGGKESAADEGKNKKEATKSENALSKDDITEMVKSLLTEQMADFKKGLGDVKTDLNAKEVSDYRKEQLEKYKDVIIEDFVPESMNSKEDVNKAIENAISKSKPYLIKDYEVDGKTQRMSIAEYEALEKPAEGEGKTKTYEPKNPPTPPEGGSGDVTGKELLSRVEDMTDEEYAKHADQILREVKSVKYQDS